MRHAQESLHELPEPEPAAAEHSARLQQRIESEIEAAGGAIPFARFMELALYAPGLGYYTAGARKFGEGGDFITAPELSPLFGRCLGRQCREVLTALGGGQVLEFGAGSGAMAADVLGELDAASSLPDAYWILEISPELRARQAETLRRRVPHLVARVQWLDTLPADFRGMILANEVLDAMPVQRFRVEDDGLRELGVARDGPRFRWQPLPADPRLAQAVGTIERDLGGELAGGYESEIGVAHDPWIRSIAGVLDQGVALLIDYGYPRREYYHPQRSRGTLMCHYRQRAHSDPFRLVGLQDITAYVDFTTIAEAAVAAGLELAGFTTQAHFLIGAGLERVLADAGATETRAQLELARQIKILTLPGEMGERFKVMALTKNYNQTLSGFTGPDLRGRL